MKKICAIMLVVLLLSVVLTMPVRAKDDKIVSEKEPEKEDKYEDYLKVSSVEDMKKIESAATEKDAGGAIKEKEIRSITGKYVLTKDIDASNEDWSPIGIVLNQTKTDEKEPKTRGEWEDIVEGEYNGTVFDGIFDGAGYVIYNIKASNTEAATAFGGIFGTLGENARISNLTIINAEVANTASYTGGLAGRALAGSQIQNVHLTNISISSTTNIVGGLVGDAGGFIGNCSVTGPNITGTATIGGFVGDLLSSGKIIRCSSIFGEVEATTTQGGGFAGNIAGEVYDSYTTSNTTAAEGVVGFGGGFAGTVFGGGSKTYRSYAAGKVFNEVNGTYGGFIGARLGPPGPATTNCFYDNWTTTLNISALTSTGKNTSDMQNYTTFDTAAWDIATIATHTTEVWYIDDGNDYPRLDVADMPRYLSFAVGGWSGKTYYLETRVNITVAITTFEAVDAVTMVADGVNTTMLYDASAETYYTPLTVAKDGAHVISFSVQYNDTTTSNSTDYYVYGTLTPIDRALTTSIDLLVVLIPLSVIVGFFFWLTAPIEKKKE